MPDRDDRLAELALAVSDGTPIDWNAADSSAASESERRQIRDLRVVADCTGAHDRAVSAPPAEWGPLRLVERIGRGRFGDVYRAWDRRLDREVALKLIRRLDPETDDMASDVIEEARLLARVRHPNVVTVYGADRIDGRAGLWMELIRGETLEHAVTTRGPFSLEEAATVGADVARALDAVHRTGLVHRDVKAQNVMRDQDGRIVLMDFGTGRDFNVAGPPELAGTPLYLAPEVLEGAPATPRSDVFSVGVLLHHLSTGSFPVRGATLGEIRQAHRQRAGMPTVAITPGLPPALRDVVDRAMAGDPAARFESAADLAVALDRCSGTRNSGEGIPARRRPSIRSIALGALLVTTTIIGVWAAGLRPAASDASARRVICDDCGMLADPSVSADGRMMALVDLTTNDLRVRDNRSGAATPLGVAGAAAGLPGALSLFPQLSRNGQQVAFMWISEKPDALELRLAPTRPGGAIHRLIFDPNLGAIPLGWSADGRSVLASVLQVPSGPDAAPWATDIVWISVADGSRRVVTSLEFLQEQVTAGVSPDGHWIAFASVPRPRAGLPPPTRRPIMVVAASGGPPEAITQDGLASHPVWSADGTRLFFRSNAAGTPDLWSVSIHDGRRTGPPVLVRKDIGASAPIRMTAGNELFFYERQDGMPESRIVRLSAAGSTPASSLIGSRPAWSPDGRSIALLRPASGGGSDVALVVHDVASGREAVHRIPGLRAFTPHWFGDSTGILVLNNDGQRGFWSRLDSSTGEVRKLIENRGNPRIATHWNVRALAPDGATLYFGAYERQPPDAPLNRIVAADLGTGEYRDVLKLPGTAATWPRTAGHLALAVSPDGQRLAIQTVDPSVSRSTMWTIGVNGRNLRSLSEPFAAAANIDGRLTWSADGRFILFTEPGTPSQSGVASFRVMRLPASGGKPEYTGFASDGWLNTFSVSSDGLQIIHDGVPTAGARNGVWTIRVPVQN